MKHEYEKIIQEFDKTLNLLRKKFLNADFKDAPSWIKRIDGALDERLRLMKLRDENI